MTRAHELLLAVLFVSVLYPSEQIDTHDLSPDDLLQRADHLAWLTDWHGATPFYRRAETAFREKRDLRGEMYARFGRTRGEMQTKPLAEISAQLGDDLESSLAKADERLRLRGYTIKGDIDLEWNVLEARRDWQQVSELARRLGDKRWEHRATGELGMIAFMQGDTGSAKKLVEQAFRGAWWSGDLGAQLRYMGSIANGLLQAGYPDSAMGWVEKALAFSKKHPQIGFPYVVYSTKAMTLLRLNREEEAERVVQTALAHARAGDRRIKEVELLMMLANIANRRSQPDRAIAYLERASERARTGQVHRLLADVQEDLARAYKRTGHFEAAESYAMAAVRDTEASGNHFALPARLAALAEIHAAQGELTEADDTYQRATDVVEAVMLNVPTPDAQARLIGVTSDVFLGHFRVAAAQQAPEKAFVIVERARGRAIADLLRVTPKPDETSAVRAQFQQLSQIQSRLLTTTSQKHRLELLEDLWQTEQDMAPDRMISREALASSRAPITLATLQRTLRPDEVLLEYVLDEPRSFCLVVTRQTQRIVQLASRKDVESSVDDFVRAVRSSAVPNEAGSLLYEQVIAPTRSSEHPRRLIVVPDGRLHGLPFDTLLSLNDSRAPAVTIAPSGSVLHLLRAASTSKARPRRRLLAVGGVPYQAGATITLAATSERSGELRGLFDAAQPSKLGPLPTARSEVLAAARLMGASSEAITGDRASESTLKAMPLNTFDMLHFAVHGIVDPKYPDRAALVLLGDPAAGEDGLLQAREISRLPLNASVVVLSACNTAVGPTIGQEGTATLGRAFLIAGARAVVTTLWSVSDATSTALMTRFYEQLAAGHDVATSLAQAKSQVLEQFGNDALATVAAFQLVGDAHNVFLRHDLTDISPEDKEQAADTHRTSGRNR